MHLLLLTPEGQPGHYLKLVPVWDTARRVDALRHEQMFSLSKMPIRIALPAESVVPVKSDGDLAPIVEDLGEIDS